MRNFKPLSGNPSIKKVISGGCGRSGTLYMKEVLNILGIEVGHESFGLQGICSWYMAEDTRACELNRYLEGHDVTYIHLVRHPLKVISSMFRCELLPYRSGIDIFRRTYPELKRPNIDITYTALWWYVWNLDFERNYNIDIRVKVEEIATKDTLSRMCKEIGIDYKQGFLGKVKGLGTNHHTMVKKDKEAIKRLFGMKYLETITFKELYRLDADVAMKVKKLAHKYGYQI